MTPEEETPAPPRLSEADRLLLEAQERVTALAALADELNESGHPYGEDLCLVAQCAMQTRSVGWVLLLETAFHELKAMEKSERNDDAAQELRLVAVRSLE
jgi:hypothetical protein